MNTRYIWKILLFKWVKYSIWKMSFLRIILQINRFKNKIIILKLSNFSFYILCFFFFVYTMVLKYTRSMIHFDSYRAFVAYFLKTQKYKSPFLLKFIILKIRFFCFWCKLNFCGKFNYKQKYLFWCLNY